MEAPGPYSYVGVLIKKVTGGSDEPVLLLKGTQVIVMQEVLELTQLPLTH